jgi:hypothetical protein
VVNNAVSALGRGAHPDPLFPASTAISVFLSLLWSGTSRPPEPKFLTPCPRSSPFLPLVGGLAGDIELQLLVHAAFGGLGLFSIRHDKDSAGSIFADHP